jgi:ribonuclease VapC
VILDSSALVAIILDEPERGAFIEKINAAPTVGVAAPTLVEAGIVLSSRLGAPADSLLADLLSAADAVVIDFGSGHWKVAVAAWNRFGRTKHAANLDFGDCIAYATARVASEPLLAKRDDFGQTDIPLA